MNGEDSSGPGDKAGRKPGFDAASITPSNDYHITDKKLGGVAGALNLPVEEPDIADVPLKGLLARGVEQHYREKRLNDAYAAQLDADPGLPVLKDDDDEPSVSSADVRQATDEKRPPDSTRQTVLQQAAGERPATAEKMYREPLDASPHDPRGVLWLWDEDLRVRFEKLTDAMYSGVEAHVEVERLQFEMVQLFAHMKGEFPTREALTKRNRLAERALDHARGLMELAFVSQDGSRIISATSDLERTYQHIAALSLDEVDHKPQEMSDNEAARLAKEDIAHIATEHAKVVEEREVFWQKKEAKRAAARDAVQPVDGEVAKTAPTSRAFLPGRSTL